MAGPSGLAVNIWRVGEEYWVAGVAAAVLVFSDGGRRVRVICGVLKLVVYIQLLWGMGDGGAAYWGSGNDMWFVGKGVYWGK